MTLHTVSVARFLNMNHDKIPPLLPKVLPSKTPSVCLKVGLTPVIFFAILGYVYIQAHQFLEGYTT